MWHWYKYVYYYNKNEICVIIAVEDFFLCVCVWLAKALWLIGGCWLLRNSEKIPCKHTTSAGTHAQCTMCKKPELIAIDQYCLRYNVFNGMM